MTSFTPPDFDQYRIICTF